MKEIEITKGYKAIVDDDDYDKLCEYKWSANVSKNTCYVVSRINGKNIGMHRFILNAEDGKDVDHINGNGLDNRKSNLRVCTHAQNLMNMKLRTDSTSGKKGVGFDKKSKSWRVQIIYNGIRKYLGRYKNKEDAINAREKAEIEFFGEYANRR